MLCSVASRYYETFGTCLERLSKLFPPIHLTPSRQRSCYHVLGLDTSIPTEPSHNKLGADSLQYYNINQRRKQAVIHQTITIGYLSHVGNSLKYDVDFRCRGSGIVQ